MTAPEGAPDGDGDGEGRTDKPVPLYLVGGDGEPGGEGEPDSLLLDLVTLVVARSVPRSGLPPEDTLLLRACRHPLSTAELSAHLALPFGAVARLVARLAAGGWVEIRQARRPGPVAPDPDVEILKALIDGLQRL
jgi:hypothetical protein